MMLRTLPALVLGLMSVPVLADCPPGERCTEYRDVKAQNVLVQYVGGTVQVYGIIRIAEHGDLSSLHVRLELIRGGQVIEVPIDQTYDDNGGGVPCPEGCVGGGGQHCGWSNASDSGTCEASSCCVGEDFWGHMICTGYTLYCDITLVAAGGVNTPLQQGDTLRLSAEPNVGFADVDTTNNIKTLVVVR